MVTGRIEHGVWSWIFFCTPDILSMRIETFGRYEDIKMSKFQVLKHTYVS